MAKVAVIVNVYNSWVIAKQCLAALRRSSSQDVFAVLIDQHSPDAQTREILRASNLDSNQKSNASHKGMFQREGIPIWHDHYVVLDPGKNIGAHNGFNYGFEHGVLGPLHEAIQEELAGGVPPGLLPERAEYVVKLDDDTVITTQDWDKIMVAGLKERPDIAILSADGTAGAKQMDDFSIIQTQSDPPLHLPPTPVYDLKYQIPPRNIVDFHCVMFRVADMMKWERPTQGKDGYTGRVWMTNPEGDGDKRLYGGEELYLARKVRAEGRKIAYFPPVFCNHLDMSAERCQDYPLWKYIYGIRRWTDKPVDEWRTSGEMLRDMRQLVGLWALNQEGWGKPYVLECVRRIGDIGEARDAGALLLVAHGNPGELGNYKPRTDMPEIMAECEKSSLKLQEKFKGGQDHHHG